MPDSAIRGVNVQYIVRLAEMGPLLSRLTVADHIQSTPSQLPIEERSDQACPACGGAMTTVRMGALHEYRCHIGHRFGLQTLISQKSLLVEHALELALSQCEELTALLEQNLEESAPESPEWLRTEIATRKNEQAALRRLTRGGDGPDGRQSKKEVPAD